MNQQPDMHRIAIDGGLSVGICNVGATLASIRVPVAGREIDVLLGYDDPADYLADPYFLGSTIGRYANRLRNARVKISGKVCHLDANEQPAGHCLHGGSDGLHRQVFEIDKPSDKRLIRCRHISPDGTGGFPGNVEMVVTYSLIDAMTLRIEFEANSDAETILSVSNHAYFNLSAGEESADTHELRIHAAEYTPTDETMIPTGELLPVAGTQFDFNTRRAISETNYDVNFALAGAAGGLRNAAELFSAKSGVCLRMSTTQPGLQLYTGQHLGSPFVPRQGICLEAQNFPDAPNQPGFPCARLMPGETYRQSTILRLSIV